MRDGFTGDRLERLYSPPEIGAPGKRRHRTQRRDLLLAGGFVLAMAVVVVALLAFMTPGLLGRTYRLDTYFRDAEGLDIGMKVLQSGYAIGLVEQVQPLFDTAEFDPCHFRGDGAAQASRPCFLARLRIKRDWPIPGDSVARIDSEGLLKGDAIMILPGTSTRQLRDGDTIAAKDREPDLATTVGDLVDSAETLIDDSITPAVESLHAQIRTLASILGTSDAQGESRKRLAGTFENLQVLSEHLRNAVDPEAVRAILTSFTTMSENLASMTSELRGSTGDIQQAVTSYGDLAVDVRGLIKENRPTLQKSLDDTQYLLQELAAALMPILTNIEDATRNLSALSLELRNDPKTILQDREVEEQTPWFK